MTKEELLTIIKECAATSSGKWDAAITTAEGERREKFKQDAEACEASYEAAYFAIRDEAYEAAKDHLHDAWWREYQAGDDADSRQAQRALAELLGEEEE